MTTTVVCLVGMPGSRKSLFADALAPLGYEKVTMSDILGERLRARGANGDPPDYRQEGALLREEHGEEALARLTWERLSPAPQRRAVIDGVRSLSEALWFLDQADAFVLVAVQAETHARWRRLATYPHGFYPNRPDRMRELDAHELRRGVCKLIALADTMVWAADPTAKEPLWAHFATRAGDVHAMAIERARQPKPHVMSEIARLLRES